MTLVVELLFFFLLLLRIGYSNRNSVLAKGRRVRGSNPLTGKGFSLPRNALTNTGDHPAPSSIGIGVPSWGYSGRSIHLATRLRMIGALTILPHTLLHGFEREKFTFSLLCIITVNSDNILYCHYQHIDLEVAAAINCETPH
jgi:hypothetical protein